MKNKIQELNALTINQIAAGEVVERPLSIVKELVENSIDAQATAITVEIREGGMKLVRVTDNGTGIEKDEVKKAFCRHFTSKLETIEDLYSIESLGFRGEALAAISGVTKTEMITKTEEAPVGVRLELEGMTEHSFEEVGAPKGTTLVAKDLFFNTPARRKFLKSEKTESSYVIEFMQRISLAYRNIAFKLIVDGKVKLQTNGDGDLRAAILYIFGSETAKRLKEVKYAEKGIAVSGYIGTPELNRGNRNYEIYFVNGRYVKSKWIQEGIEEGAFGYTMQHQFPFAVLEIAVAPDKLDVNVHPQKAEVRFENGYLIKEVVNRAVAEALREKEEVPAVVFEKTAPAFQPDKQSKTSYTKAEPFEVVRVKEENRSRLKEDFSKLVSQIPMDAKEDNTVMPVEVREGIETLDFKATNTENRLQNEDESEKPETTFVKAPKEETIAKQADFIEKSDDRKLQMEQEFIDLRSLKKHRVIGQVFDTYWMVEFQGALYIIDQHAAHEKVLYERFVKQFNDSQIHSQQLLEPLVISLNHREIQNYEAAKDFFDKLGFEIENFGGNTLKVVGVPYLFNASMNKEEFIFLLDQMENKSFKENAQTIDHELATMACKAAVKGNNKLSDMEYARLIEELLTLQNPYHCPHGRPTLIKMTRYELDRKFKRIL